MPPTSYHRPSPSHIILDASHTRHELSHEDIFRPRRLLLLPDAVLLRKIIFVDALICALCRCLLLLLELLEKQREELNHMRKEKALEMLIKVLDIS